MEGIETVVFSSHRYHNNILVANAYRRQLVQLRIIM